VYRTLTGVGPKDWKPWYPHLAQTELVHVE
jgi:hypothetical protein